MHKWRVLDEITLNDHNYIEYPIIPQTLAAIQPNTSNLNKGKLKKTQMEKRFTILSAEEMNANQYTEAIVSEIVNNSRYPQTNQIVENRSTAGHQKMPTHKRRQII